MSQTPDYLRPEVLDAQPSLQLVKDLLSGSAAMVASPRVKEYLPQWPKESDTTWGKRVRSATLYKGFERTLSASVGMLYQKPPTITYSDTAGLERHAENIDDQGNAFPVFAKRFSEAAIAGGYAVIVVDFPARPDVPVVTRESEAGLGLRSRWTYYHRTAVCSWRTAVVRGHLHITQLVLHEPGAADDGDYGIVPVDRYRVLRVVGAVAGYELWRKPTDSSQDWALDDAGTYADRRGNTRDTLPVAIAYTGRTDAPFTAMPPLQGVAEANLAHWRAKTELTWGSRLAAIEQPVVIGQLAPDPTTHTPPTSVPVGWDHTVNVSAGGDFKFVGPSGAGLTQLKDRMLEAEQEMAALGMSFLSRDTRAAETAEAKRLDATAQNSTAATATQGLEDAFNLAWQYDAWFEGVPMEQAPVVTMNRDFDESIDIARAALIEPLLNTGMPIRKAAEILREDEIVSFADEDDFEDFILEWETGKVAEEDAARLEAERRMPLPQAA